MSDVSGISSSSSSASTSTSASTSLDLTLSEQDVVEAKYEEALEPAYQLETDISANETLIAAYSDMQSLLQSLESSLSSLHDATDTSSDVFSQRSAALIASSTSSTVQLSASVAAGTAIGTHTLVVRQVATAERIAGSEFGSDTTSLGLAGVFTLAEADGSSASITVSSGMSLSDIETAINDQSSATGVTASILEISSDEYRLVLTAADTNQAIDFSSVSGDDIAQSLGLVDASGNYVDEIQAAQPAILDVDGVDGIERDSNDISDIIEGVTLNLTQADPSSTVTMSIGYDTSAIETALDTFVSAYNGWRDFVEQNQATSSDGTASSTATLFSDQMLRGASDEIMTALSSEVNGNALAAFGIGFDNDEQLTIDTATLESALADDVTDLQSLFDYQASISDADLVLTSHSGSSYSGSFTLNISTDSSGDITSVDVGGDTSLFTVSGNMIMGVAGSIYDGLNFYYSGTASAAISVSLSQGIGDQIYQAADRYANTLTGALTTEISSLESQDTDMESQVSDIESSAAQYESFLLSLYGTMEAQMAENSNTLTLLQTLLAVESSSS